MTHKGRKGTFAVKKNFDKASKEEIMKMFFSLLFKQLSLMIIVSGILCSAAFAASPYDVGSPVLKDIWTDPVNGNDSNNGSERSQALRTVGEAWNRIPSGTALTGTGYRILLVPGDYSEAVLPASGWMEARYGTVQYPVILQAADGPHTVRLHGYLSLSDVRYLYLIHLDIVTDPGYGGSGNTLHIEGSDHILIRGCKLDGFDGAKRQPQETLKVNQTQYIYVEDSEISGGDWFSLDFVAVQYGHILNNRIYDSGDDCLLMKGGTAYFTVEGNEIYDSGNIGFAAGQGTGFEFMVSPWLHYEVYDIRFVNNVLHDVTNAGMAVRGGYNILMAYNTLYRVGYDVRGSGILLIAHGSRSCDGGNTAACEQNRQNGGWGKENTDTETIPNRNVYVYDNIFYNPDAEHRADSHFVIHGPASPPENSNIPNPSYSDTNLQIRGNLIWNKTQSEVPFGIGEGSGCQSDNSTCNLTQLTSENTVNSAEPQLVNPAQGDFRPAANGNVFGAAVFPIPDFTWADAPSPPTVPAGTLSNTVSYDRDRISRTSSSPPGAYFSSSAVIARLSDVILILKLLSGIEISGIGSIRDINGDGKIGLEEAAFALKEASEAR
jgi:hypothetical protein